MRTCPAALGPGFAAGTTDGPGVFGFQQGDTEVSSMADGMNLCLSFFDCLNFGFAILLQINKLWKQLRDSLKKPSEFQVGCQKPKTVLLDTGEMFEPYAVAVRKKRGYLKSITNLMSINSFFMVYVIPWKKI